jgi:hypothetical protein
MYGYDGKPPVKSGSWRETFSIMQVVFGVVAPLIGLFGLIVCLLLATAGLALWHPPLALIPLGVLAGGVVYLIRKDKQTADRDEEHIFGEGHR